MLKGKKAHQDTSTKSSQKKMNFGNIFGLLKIKLNIKRKKNDKPKKCHEFLEVDQQQPSSDKPLSNIAISQSFSDEDLIESELTVDSSTKSSASSDSLEKIKEEKSYMKLFKFSRKFSTANSSSTCSVNSSVECSNGEQNDSAYETESENNPKKKKITRTKMTTLSKNDKEYIEIQKLFKIGLPNKQILGIIRLQMPTKLVEAHERYKKQMDQSSYKMFHGTKTAKLCNPKKFVNKKYPNLSILCKFGCGVCGIVQEGNRKKYSKYTDRMWFANSSATSLSYCTNGNVNAMFVVDVVFAYSNSILIVDKDEATIPRYLIVFK